MSPKCILEVFSDRELKAGAIDPHHEARGARARGELVELLRCGQWVRLRSAKLWEALVWARLATRCEMRFTYGRRVKTRFTLRPVAIGPRPSSTELTR